MAYDETLAERVRRVVGPRPEVSEKKMFGGLAFLLSGKMFVGVNQDDLMVRVGPVGHEHALAQPHARPMDFTGRPMVGYVFVARAGLSTDARVSRWVERALGHVSTLVEGPRTVPQRSMKTKKAKAKPPGRPASAAKVRRPAAGDRGHR
jgi:TfoX/Sxy family transcriptional regulator of competence genes